MERPLEQIKSPLIEGEKVIFVWQGQAPVQLIGDFTNWRRGGAPLMLESAGTNLWSYTLNLPTDAYIEYAFLQNGTRLPDPLNPNTTYDGFGNTNSYSWMPNAKDTPLVSYHQPDIPKGDISRYEVEGKGLVVGQGRTVQLYQPPVKQPVPLLVVFDGSGYLEQARINVIVDNLIAQGAIEPVALALVDPGGEGRAVEYACSDTTVAFVIDCVLPLAQKQLNLLDIGQFPGKFGMMGASMGGLMSLYTALRAPHIFGLVLCQSGAFGADHPDYRLYYRSVIEDLLKYAPPVPIKIWQDVGSYEWFYGPNHRMNALLKARGYNVTYREHNSGHNYPSWRNILAEGLKCLFPKTGDSK